MKKIICVLALVAALFSATSCENDKPSLSFSPSSVTVNVGQSKTVNIVLGGMTGVHDVQFLYPSDLVQLTTSFNTVTVRGVKSGSGVINAYVKDQPSVTATLPVTVK